VLLKPTEAALTVKWHAKGVFIPKGFCDFTKLIDKKNGL
jgi:hypothetical protein